MNTKTKNYSLLLQNLLIKYILSPLYNITKKISPRIKDAGFVLSGVMIVILFFVHSTGILSMRYLFYFSIGCLFLGIMILCTINKDMQPISFKPAPMILWFIAGITMLFSGIFNSVDFLPEAVLFTVAYPILFIVWNNNDEKYIFSRLMLIIKISFLIYIITSALFFPMLSLRYSGLFTNVNGAAEYYVIVSVFLLIDFLNEKLFSAKFIRNAVLLGLCISLLMYTNSRTGLIALFLAAIIGLCVYFFTNTRGRRKIFFSKLGTLIVSVILFFTSSIYIFQLGKYINLPSLNMYSKTDETINFEESWELSKDRFFITDSDGIEGTGESAISIYSTGRLGIWTEYAKQLNLLGHKDAGTAQFIYKGENKTYHTAHMTILQFAYENGIVSGIAYFLFNIVAGIISFKYAVKHKHNQYAIIPFLVSVAYGVISLFSNTTISFWYLSALMYYLVQFPILKKESSQPI